jgi:hypothetical protein
MARNRKETNVQLDEFAKEFRALCDKHGLISALMTGATSLKSNEGKMTIGMGMAFAGSPMMHESLCAYAFGYMAGNHVELMDEMKAAGTESYHKSK